MAVSQCASVVRCDYDTGSIGLAPDAAYAMLPDVLHVQPSGFWGTILSRRTIVAL